MEKQSYFLRSAIKEISLIRKHFGVTGTGDKVTVKGYFSPSNIQSFFKEYFATVRPKNLSEDKIIPSPNPTILRALYIGHPDVNILLNLIVRHSLYVDQIAIIDPFAILPHHLVLSRPRAWAQVIANRALSLVALEEWIKQEIVLVIPSIFQHHPELNDFIQENKVSLEKLVPIEDPRDFEKYILLRFLVNELPDVRDSALDVFEGMGKKFRDGEREDLLNAASEYEAEYPIRYRLPAEYYNQFFKNDETISQVLDFSLGVPLFLAPTLADELGAYLLFERKQLYKSLVSSQFHEKSKNKAIQELGIAFQSLDFPFLHNVPLKMALKLRNKGYLHSFRVYLKDLWIKATSVQDGENLDVLVLEFTDRLKSEYIQLQREWESISKELKVKAITSGLAIGLSAGSAVVIGNIGWTAGAVIGASAGVIKEQVNGYLGVSKSMDKLYQNALSVFVALEKG